MPTLTPASRTYLLEFGGAMLAYIILLPLSLHLNEANPTAPWRVPVALLPVIPVALSFWAVLRYVGRLDEMQRRIQFEALVAAVGATIVLTFAYGALENLGLPSLNLMGITPLIVVLWSLGLVLANRRYR